MQSDLIATDCPVDGIRQPKPFSGKVYGAWACGSEGERLTGSQKVGGSSPPRSIFLERTTLGHQRAELYHGFSALLSLYL
jgi:hypothetical protein